MKESDAPVTIKLHSHNIVCLQETWLLDSILWYLNTINDDYICTDIAGVDSYDSIIRGRPKVGGGGLGVGFGCNNVS